MLGLSMLQITKKQQERLSKVSLDRFHRRLADQLKKANLLPPAVSASEPGLSLVATIVSRAQEFKLEYESDIAVYAAFVLSSNPDTEEGTGVPWMDEILQQRDTSGDEKMTIIDMRWRRLAEQDPTLMPSPALLDEISEAF